MSLKSNLVELFKQIESLKLSTAEAYKKIAIDAHHYVIQVMNARFYGKPEPYTLTDEDLQIARFLSEFDIFSRAGFEFFRWSDIAEEGLSLLKEMLEKNDFDYKNNPKFAEFKKRVSKRQDDLDYLVHGDWLGH